MSMPHIKTPVKVSNAFLLKSGRSKEPDFLESLQDFAGLALDSMAPK